MNRFHKIPLNYGTLAGLVSFSLFLALYFSGRSPFMFWKFTGSWIPVACIIVSCLVVKHKVQGGRISFRRGFFTGMVAAFTFSSLKALMVYMFVSFTDNHVVAQFLQQFQELLNSQPMLAASYDMKEIRDNFSMSTVAIQDFNLNFMVGIFVAAIVARIIRNIPWNPEEGA